MSSIAELQKQVREGKELRITGDVDNTDKEFINIFMHFNYSIFFPCPNLWGNKPKNRNT